MSRPGPIDAVLGAVADSGLLPDDAPVLVLLSGGRDSVCLLDAAVRTGRRRPVAALHVDYGIRPGAEADADHCRELCDALGVPLEVHRPIRPAGGNLQAWARDVRYGRAAELTLERGGVVATAHTASDQAETVLYRLAASPGRRALLGMPARRGRLVRPLLAVTRAQTTAYCRAAGLAWRDDETNDGDRFARGRVRGRLLPALEAIHPAAEANLVETARRLGDESQVLDAVLDSVLDGQPAIALDRLAGLPPAMRRLVVGRLAEDAAGAAAPRVVRRVDDLLALVGHPGSRRLDLGGGLQAHVEYGVLRFALADPGDDAGTAGVALPVPGRIHHAGYVVEARAAGPAPGGPDPLSCVLDAERLTDGLVVRTRRSGDRIRPLGLGGSRSLQDLLTDRRVPRARRDTLPVVESGGDIAWVAGVEIGDRFKVTAATRATVRLRARPLGPARA